MWKKIAPFVLILLVIVPAASAAGWQFKNVEIYPEQPSNGSDAVVVAQLAITNSDGDTTGFISPTKCDSLSTVLFYGSQNLDMEYIEGSEGYFYIDKQVTLSEKTGTLYADGSNCQIDGSSETDIRFFSEHPSDTVTGNELFERFPFEGSEEGEKNAISLIKTGITDTQSGIRRSQGYIFSGNSYIDVESSEMPGESPESYTISAFIRPEDSTGAVYSKNSKNYTSGLKMGLNGGVPYFELYSEDSDGPITHTLNLGQDIAMDRWHHVAAVFRDTGSGYNISVYSDRNIQHKEITGNVSHSTKNPVIGAAYNGSGSRKDFFEGRMDEVRFYNDALTKEELEQITDSAFSGFYETDITRSVDMFLETNTSSFSFEGTISTLDDDYGDATASWEHLDYLGNSQGGQSFSVPGDAESLYIMKLTENPQTVYPPFASEEGEAHPIIIKQKVEGSVHFVNTDTKCNTNISKCEKGVNLTVHVREDQSSADNASVRIKDDSDSVMDSFNATRKNETHWHGSFKIPEDTNSSSFNAEATLKNAYSEHTSSETVETNPFTLNVNTDTDYELRGNEISLQAYPMTPYTSELYPLRSIQKAVYTVYGPNGNQMEQKTIQDDIANYFNSRQGMVSYSYRIPLDASHGEYSFETSLTDSSGFQRTSERHKFTVRNVSIQPSDVQIKDISSSISSEEGVESIEKTFTGTGKKTGSIRVKNQGDVKGDVKVNFTGDLKDVGRVVEVNNGGSSPFTLHPSTQAVVDIEFDFETTGTYTGAITFNVSGELDTYSRRIETKFTVVADCSIQEGDICIMDENVDKEILSEGGSVPIELKNQGDTELTFDYSATGNLSDIVSSGSVDLPAGTEQDVNISTDATAADNGYYEGDIEFTDGVYSASIPVAVTVSIPVGSLEFELSETEFGEVVAGETVSVDYTVTNTGEVDFGEVRIHSSEGGVDTYLEDSSGNREGLSAGSSGDGSFDMDTSDIDPGDYTGENSIKITAESDTSARDSGELEGTVYEDISGSLDSIEARLDSLETEIESLEISNKTGYESRLQKLQGQVESANSAWESGDYSSAQSTFETLDQETSYLNSDVSEAKRSTSDTGGSTGSTSGGGFSIWLIIVPLLFLIIIGAVLYLSIVPEE